MVETAGTIWVCTDCVQAHANGEDTTPEALTRLPEGHTVALGMGWDEHDCANAVDIDPWAGPVECDCERIEFSRRTCEGCGSPLAGERHALTLFVA